MHRIITALEPILSQLKEIGPLTVSILGLIGLGASFVWLIPQILGVVQGNTEAMTRVVTAAQAQSAYNVQLQGEIDKVLDNQRILINILKTERRLSD